VTATSFYFKTADGVRLYGATIGAGRTGVVLAPQNFGTACEWVAEAKLLAAHGYRAMVFDYRSTGHSQMVRGKLMSRIDRDVLAAASGLRKRGATKIVLMGSLLGGAAVLRAAIEIPSPVAALVALAPPDSPYEAAHLPQYGALDPSAAAARVQAPVLFVAGGHDIPVEISKGLYDTLTVSDKQLVVAVSDAMKGVDLLKDAKANRAVLDFIAAHVGG
jgi:pimeloyl-ACP methyl ester carboxylesterase